MSILDKIFRKKQVLEVFLPPYTDSQLDLNTQLITNLEHGILFEDTNQLISWSTSFNEFKKVAVEIKERGDRTELKHGKRKVLNGLELNFYTMQWINTSPKLSFGSIESFLGHENEGKILAEIVTKHLIENLGEPVIKTEDDGEYSREWKFNKAKISIVCWQHFSWKYELKIGLINEPNWEFLNK